MKIYVFTEERHLGPLPARIDKGLSVCLISKDLLKKMKAPYTPCPPSTTFTDSENKVHVPVGQVKLEWHRASRAKDYLEVFYVIKKPSQVIVLDGVTAEIATAPGIEINLIGLVTKNSKGTKRYLPSRSA